MSDHNIEHNSDYIYKGDFTSSTAYEITKKMLANGDYPDAIFLSKQCKILKKKPHCIRKKTVFIFKPGNIQPFDYDTAAIRLFDTTNHIEQSAFSSEILTRADNLFEFDQEGNCYQKLDHQNHR